MSDNVWFATSDAGANSSAFNGFPLRIEAPETLPISLSRQEAVKSYWRVKSWHNYLPCVKCIVSADSTLNISTVSGDHIHDETTTWPEYPWLIGYGVRFYFNGSWSFHRALDYDQLWDEWVQPNSASAARPASTVFWYQPIAKNQETGVWDSITDLTYYGGVGITFMWLAQESFDPASFDQNNFDPSAFKLYYRVTAQAWPESDASSLPVLEAYGEWTETPVAGGTITAGTPSVNGTGDLETVSISGTMSVAYSVVTDLEPNGQDEYPPYWSIPVGYSFDVRPTYGLLLARPEGDSEKMLCFGNYCVPRIAKLSLNDSEDAFSIVAPGGVSQMMLGAGKILGQKNVEGCPDGYLITDGFVFPKEYWPYSNQAGTAPIWDSVTGAQINDPLS